MDLRKLIQQRKSLQKSSLLNSFSYSLVKAKPHPVGTINKWHEMKMPDGSWKYVGKKGANHPAALELKEKGYKVGSRGGTLIDYTEDPSARYRGGDIVQKDGSINVKIGPGKWVELKSFLKTWEGQEIPSTVKLNTSNLKEPQKSIIEDHLKGKVNLGLEEGVEKEKLHSESPLANEFMSIVEEAEDYLEVAGSVAPYLELPAYSRELKQLHKPALDFIKEKGESLTKEDIKEILSTRNGLAVLSSLLKDEVEYSDKMMTLKNKEKEEELDSKGALKETKLSYLMVLLYRNISAPRVGPKSETQHADISKLNLSQVQMIRSYCGPGYICMNAIVRGEYEYKSNFIKNLAESIVEMTNDGIRKIENKDPESNKNTFRVVNFRTGDVRARAKNKLVDYISSIGDDISENMFFSTSNNPKNTFTPSEGKSITYSIDNSVGVGKRVEDISPHSSSETEVLYPFDTVYRVDRIEVDKWWKESGEKSLEAERRGRQLDGDYHVTLTARK